MELNMARVQPYDIRCGLGLSIVISVGLGVHRTPYRCNLSAQGLIVMLSTSHVSSRLHVFIPFGGRFIFLCPRVLLSCLMGSRWHALSPVLRVSAFVLV